MVLTFLCESRDDKDHVTGVFVIASPLLARRVVHELFRISRYAAIWTCPLSHVATTVTLQRHQCLRERRCTKSFLLHRNNYVA